MNKSELIALIAERTQFTKKDSEKVINTMFDIIAEKLKGGEKVQITGFGTFEVRNRAARKGHNPTTGEEIDIPAGKAPAFKAGKTLKEAIV